MCRARPAVPQRAVSTHIPAAREPKCAVEEEIARKNPTVEPRRYTILPAVSDVRQPTPQTGATVTVQRSDLDSLLAAIAGQGYQVVGPTVRDGAIVYGDVRSSADLPVGWSDEQDGGTYRLRRRDDQAVFGYAVGPQSWKQFLHPPKLRLWRARRGENGEGLEILEEPTPSPRFAFIGVRSCELHAIAIQDQVFLPGAHPDLSYAARREDVLLVAVNCGEPGGTCFCVSMNTGPKASSGYDLALTEVLDGGRHQFVVEIGSDRGALGTCRGAAPCGR